MAQLPDFRSMTEEEIGEWFLSADTNALLVEAQPPSEPMVRVIDPEQEGIREPGQSSPGATADRGPASPPPE
jgi:hypothetical protein